MHCTIHIEHVSAKQPPHRFTWKVGQGGVAAVKMTGGALCVVVSTVSGELCAVLSESGPERTM